jgi:23S rRNA pseudouridine2604 synthase
MTEEMNKKDLRINVFLAKSGLCSRRAADELIREGKVIINGEKANLGARVTDSDQVFVDGERVCLTQAPEPIYIALNKPEGVVCTTDREDPANIIDFLGFKERVFPIGRLDKASTGLILLTNDGSIVNRILRAQYGHEKEYVVRVDKPITAKFLRSMASGVPILDTITKPCKVRQINEMEFRIVLTQGLNRQIRRMCEHLGYRVRALRRVRIMNITLGNLKLGAWRNLTFKEMRDLEELLRQRERQV